MSTFKTVRKGSTGEDVKVLQTVLSMLQFLGADGKPLSISGFCDDNTVYAINSFQTVQRAYGYECGSNGKNDGQFGERCWARLVGK